MGALESRYAVALLAALGGGRSDGVDAAGETLLAIADAIARDAGTRSLLLSPSLQASARKSAVRECVRFLAASNREASEKPDDNPFVAGAMPASAAALAKTAARAAPATAGKTGTAMPAQPIAEQPWVKMVSDFLCLLQDKGRFDLIGGIAAAFIEAKSKARNVIRVEALSSLPLEGAQIAAIKEKYARLYPNSDVEIVCRVDPSLLGGIRVQVGDTRFEGTVAGRLAAMRDALAAKPV